MLQTAKSAAETETPWDLQFFSIAFVLAVSKDTVGTIVCLSEALRLGNA